MSVFADGITNDPALMAKMSKTVPTTEPALVAIVDRIPTNVVQRFRSTDQRFLKFRCTEVALLTLDEADSLYPCTLVESWTLDSTDGKKSMRTIIDLYNITATSEQFTFAIRNSTDTTDPLITIVITSGETTTFNVGRQSEIKMYCYHCHDNIQTKMCTCRKRRFCSSECQKADWYEGGHKLAHSKSTSLLTTTTTNIDKVD